MADSGRGAPLFGVSAEFATPDALVRAAGLLRAQELGRLDAYSPTPVAGLAEVLGLHPPPVGTAALLGSLVSGIGCFLLITLATVWGYRFNIGGRPVFSWPYYIIPSLSVGLLGGAAVIVLSLLVLSRLPRLNHPVFNIDGFERSTEDRYFLCVEARDEAFDPAAVERQMARLPDRPIRVQRVPR